MTDTSTAPEKSGKGGQKHAQQQAAEAALPLASPDPAAAPQPRYIRPLPIPRIVLSHAADGNIGNRWTATVPAGTPWEDVLSDEFWANRAKDMRPGDEIRILNDKWEYFGMLLVQQTRIVGPGMVANRVSVVQESFSQSALPVPKFDPTDTFTSFEGPYKKWCIMRRDNPTPIREGYDSQQEAEAERRKLALSRNEHPRLQAYIG